MDTTFTVHIGKEQERTYFTVPFQVPEGISRLDVSYTYPGHVKGMRGDTHPQSTIDLGLCDEKGTFLGWSGSAKDHIFVGEDESEKGYLSEPVRAGTWSILVGAYHVPKQGVDVTYTVSFSQPHTELLLGDLHVHSTASDGAYDRIELSRRARKAGLDFIAFADHNNFSENFHEPYVEGLTVIPAVEWTHYQGHMNFFGVADPFENSFVANTAEDKKELLRKARARGCLISVNHPQCPICPYVWKDEDYDMMEIWNGPMTPRNERAIARWTRELSHRRPLPAVGGSDFHQDVSFVRFAHPVTGVFSKGRSAQAILRSLRGPRLWLRAGNTLMGSFTTRREILLCGRQFSGESVLLVTNEGGQVILPRAFGSFEVPFQVTGQTFAYLKAVRDLGVRKLVRAVSNPLYFTEDPDNGA